MDDLIENLNEFKEGDWVQIIYCESQPRFIGEVGQIIKITKSLIYVADGARTKRCFYPSELRNLSNLKEIDHEKAKCG